MAANAAFGQLVSVSADELRARDLMEIVRTAEPEKLARVLDGSEAEPVEIVCRGATEHEIVIEARGFTIRVGRENKQVLILRDVTEQRRTADELRRSRVHLEAVQSHAHLGSWELDVASGRGLWSREMFRLFDLDPSEGVPSLEEFAELVHPDDRQRNAEHQLAALRGETRSFRFRTNPARGPVRHLLGQARPLRRNEAEVTQLLGTVQDVTAQVESERALREREHRFRALIEHGHDVCTMFEADGTLRYISPSVERVLGWRPEELVGKTGPFLVHPDELEVAQEHFEEAMAHPGEVVHTAHRLRHADGSYRLVELAGCSLLEDPAVGAMVSNFRDVTEKRELEELLRQSQKMEAVGQLTGGIAHDFNNLLSAVLAGAELLEQALPEDAEEMKQDLLQIRTAAERGAGLVKKLLAFSRQEALQVEPVDVAAVCAETSELLRRLLPETVEILLEVEPGVAAYADPGALQQILVNLGTNARDAMPEGGRLRIAVANTPSPRQLLASRSSRARYVRIEVRDDGIGMEESVRRNLFNPFFTTKPAHHGTGLGMAMVYGLVKQQRGHILVDSEIGEGTRICVYLPAADPSALSKAIPSRSPSLAPSRSSPGVPSEAAGSARRTLLLAEDDDPLRDLAERVLEQAGYRVIAVPDGEQALAVIESDGQAIDLVVTDVVMPRMNGRSLHREARASGFAAPFLFTSGNSDFTGEDLEGNDGDVTGLLPKPWTGADLRKAVDDLLRQGAGA